MLKASNRARCCRAVPLSFQRARLSPRRQYSSVSAAGLKFGQPIHETHPHLIDAGHVTRGISAFEYAQRRAKLAERLPQSSIALLPSAQIQYRAGVVFHEFHQEANFFYLTGFDEPEALALIEKTGPGSQHKFHLYVRPKDENAQLWEGARSGPQAAKDVFNADEAGSIDKVSSILPPLLSSTSAVYTDVEVNGGRKSSMFASLGLQRQSSHSSELQSLLSNCSLQPLSPHMHELRAIKSEAEITNMRRAGQASGRAFTEAMRRRFDSEKDLAAFLKYDFKMRGCETSAYVPVVASGDNALSIHYVQNNALIEDGDLVLVDAGGQYGNYVTDITRTWPADGVFTSAQRDLYTAVLNAQRTCVALCRADANMSLDSIHDVARRTLQDALVSLGFPLTYRSGDSPPGDDLDGLFPHHVGHFVGLHLHDTPGYSRAKPLVSGQCVTIEPGLYIPDNERWPRHFRGMGIRIEDSIAVMDENPYVLTTEAVKEVVDIEALSQDH